jgi:DNA-binding response OmpR family regulator
MDLGLPRLGGIEAVRKIREAAPRLTVVAVTARLDPSLHRQALTLGARAVLVEPLDLEQLWALVLGDEAALRAYDAALAQGELARATPTPSRVARILVVDDDAEMLEAIVEFLASRGHQVTTANDAIAAVRMLGEHPADVVLLDMNMPGLSGVDALPTIRAIAPAAAVIMVTGNTDREQAKRALEYGAFDYLVKPINWTHFTQTLTMALEVKALATASA